MSNQSAWIKKTSDGLSPGSWRSTDRAKPTDCAEREHQHQHKIAVVALADTVVDPGAVLQQRNAVKKDTKRRRRRRSQRMSRVGAEQTNEAAKSKSTTRNRKTYVVEARDANATIAATGNTEETRSEKPADTRIPIGLITAVLTGNACCAEVLGSGMSRSH